MAENKSKLSIVTNGLLKENPTLRLVLGTPMLWAWARRLPSC